MTQAKTKDGNGRGVKVHVAAFGKHPGWDDHIEEIGLDTSMLVNAKRVLYTECIGGCIDSGEWEKLEDDKRIPFRHQFYWRTTDGLLIGRMWASRDGKGRTKYPMVVCAVMEGAPTDWAVSQVLPALAAVEADCSQTNSAELVRLAIGKCRSTLEAAAATLAHGQAEAETPAELLARLVQSPALASNENEGLKRVLYEMGREFVEFVPTGTTAIRSRTGSPAAQHIRVPKGLDGPGEAARAWLTLLDQEVSRAVPLLLVEPTNERYIDLIVGEVKPKQFFCVRAGEKAIGLTSDVPYTMEPHTLQAAEDKIAAWSQGRAAEGDEPITTGADTRSSRSNLKLILLGVAGVLVVTVVIVLTRASKPDTANAEPPPGETNTAPRNEPRTAEPQNAPETNPVPEPAPVAINADPADPRSHWEHDARVKEIREALDRLDRELAAENAPPLTAERQKLEDISKRAAIVRSMPWRSASKDQISRDIAQVDKELTEVDLAVKVGLVGLASRVEAYVAKRATTSPVKHRIMAAAWGTGLAAIDHAGGWSSSRAKADALEANLKAAETGLAVVPAVQAPEASMIDAGAVKTASQARHEAALRSAADAAVAGDRARVDQAVNDLKEWNAQATVVLSHAQKLEGLLASGRVLDAQAKPTAAELEASMQKSLAYADIAPAVRPVLNQVEAVRSVGALNTPAQLTQVIKNAAGDTSGTHAPAAVAAWQRLAELNWPAIPADLTEAAELRTGSLKGALDRVTDPAQRQALETLSAAPAREMWKRFASKGAVNEAGIAAAVAARRPLGISNADVESLPGFARYNLLRHELAEAVKTSDAKQGAAREEGRRAAVDKFVQNVEALGAAVANRPEVSAVLAKLKPLTDPSANLDVAKLGPGSAGWKAEPAGEDGTVSFSHEKAGTVHFRRLATDDEGACFMSTTEVSVGQFIELISAAGKWDEVRPLLASYPPGGDDPRRGPRVWEWSVNPAEMMAVSKPGLNDTSRGWLRSKTSMAGKEYYPEGLSVEPPSREHPMQYVSPTAAVIAARVMGCRLPTSAEWKAAATTGVSSAQNLRDPTWRKQYEKSKELAASQPDYPAERIFWPAEAQKVPPMQDGFAAVDADDSVLWFAPVGGGPTFQHLIGNVAEFVWEDPAVLEGLEPTSARVKAALGKGEKLKVIGGSALSHKDIAVGEPQAVNFSQAREGYSDVGFRVAFTVPKGAGSGGGAKLEEALASSGYLTGE